MSKQSVLPRTIESQVSWLQNFSVKLPAYAARYGISADEASGVQAGYNALSFWMDYDNVFSQYAQKVTGYRRELMSGVPAGVTPGAAPSIPTPGTPPALPDTVQSNIIGYATSVGNRIKSHNDYTESDGRDLGLEGAEASGRAGADDKPTLDASIGDGGHPHVDWTKAGNDAIEIWKSTDGVNWTFIAVDTTPDYTDTAALPAAGQSAVWRYKAIYRHKDEHAGQWSDVVSITVMGA
jgi:hypothetical protein